MPRRGLIVKHGLFRLRLPLGRSLRSPGRFLLDAGHPQPNPTGRKMIMKYVMRAIRAIVGPILLFLDAVFAPKAVERDADAQRRVDTAVQTLKLYQFKACPFCVRVRRQMKRLALPIETRDVKRNEKWREELLTEGGSPKVPCLRITEDSGERWLYESKEIDAYLNSRFAVGAGA